jgi:hypothetical protein
MNTSTQLKALIRNISKEKSMQAEIILRNFMLWVRYQQKNSYADDLTWVQVMASLIELYIKAFNRDVTK